MRATPALPIILFFLLMAVLAAPQMTVGAQQPTPSDDEVNAVARNLYCPVCENTPLDVCPTEACRQWRGLIRQMLAEGKSPAEIEQYFVEYYGARVLAEPPRTGLNWLVYVIPPAAFLTGLTLLLRASRTWKRAARETDAGPGSVPAAGDEYVARLEEELRQRS